MMMVVAAHGLGEVRDIGELAAGGRGLKIIRESGELLGLGGVAIGERGLGGGLQIGGDLLGDLRILIRIILLELLHCAHELREWGKLRRAVLRNRAGRRSGAGGVDARGIQGGHGHAGERLDVRVGDVGKGVEEHAALLALARPTRKP